MKANYCPKCNAPLKNDANFCTKCGKEVRTQVQERKTKDKEMIKADLAKARIEGMCKMFEFIDMFIDTDCFIEHPFLTAAEAGKLDLVIAMIKAGVDIDQTNDNCDTALMKAAESGKTAIVNYLISKNADVTMENDDGDTALSLARASRKYNIVGILKKAGAE
jgi:ribosomal protein L40E